MQTTDFREYAETLINKGMSITPVDSKKRPVAGSGWQKLRGGTILAPKYQNVWAKTKGLGIICGEASGIICLDIDILSTDKRLASVRAELEAMLPPIRCARTGNKLKPAARFFAYNGESAEKFNNIAVELLGTGNQAVIPPTIHISGEPYEWVGESLYDIDADDLPDLNDDILVWLREMNFKYKPKKKQGETMASVLRSVKGRCKSGSHLHLSSIGVAMRCAGKATDEICDRLLKEDLNINAGEPSLYFACSSRKEWRGSTDTKANVLTFVQQIEGNHEVNQENVTYPTMADGFFKYIEPKTPGGNGKWLPDYNGLADYFKNEIGFKADDSYRVTYKDGYYTHMSHMGFMSAIEAATIGKASPQDLRNFKTKIEASGCTPKEEFESPGGFINLNNGVLNIESGELLEHSPKYNFTYRLKHNYEPEAQCPRFIEYLKFVYQDDQELIDLTAEIMGYTIMGGKQYAHRAFILYGSGRNGKSTLLETITTMLGVENVSAVSMDMIKRPFSVVRMDGKLANIVEESPTNIDAESFKNITGGGMITAAKKGMDEFDLSINARLFFACNDFPKFKDTTVSINDRLVILPFKRYIKPKERDPKTIDNIVAEMPGVLNFALEGLKRFKEKGFTDSKAVAETVDDYILDSDSVKRWFEDRVEIEAGDSKVRPTPITELYSDYTEYCKVGGIHPVNVLNLGKRLKGIINKYDKEGYDYDKRSCRPGGKYRALKGIYLNSALRPGYVDKKPQF